jgi:hypothetical protein
MLLALMTSSILWSVVTWHSEAYAMGKFPWDAPEVVATSNCPELKNYSKPTVQRMAKEMKALRSQDPKAVSPGMMSDYHTLRDQCRAFATPQ